MCAHVRGLRGRRRCRLAGGALAAGTRVSMQAANMVDVDAGMAAFLNRWGAGGKCVSSQLLKRAGYAAGAE